jgi:hypothetical protein
LTGSLACINAFSFSESQEAVARTIEIVRKSTEESSGGARTVWQKEEDENSKYYCENSFSQNEPENIGLV